ncbi:MAG TPA: NAD-dependent epimerase/dehydratase family protein [Lentisphaeria bacterium]|nr:NAD-dependent epimerase/dehydratase family protein [Lentisphaerota bacterium]OQC11659.1 MAG: UDP-glucose 4-epimerase [Lentisphaerae bacterium ADurb.Bin082]HQC52080.1 NAD-dependent epimerase/dehydratase family protein [Lentisphaeria bacterium]HQL88721.1 NAD-dependent epimerase/dehydratase family protein [Lentisphaeria bacterium]
MRVLVTGGAGFIGSHLVEHFQGKADVRVLDNLRSGRLSNLQGFDVDFIEGSILDDALLAKAMSGVDVVFHLAAMISVPESMGKPIECVEINTIGTLKVLEAAARAGVKKLCLSTSAAIYGDNPIVPKRETMLPEPKSPYAETKLSGEYYCGIYTREGRLDTACLRYFNVFGPRQDPKSQYAAAVPIFISRALRQEPITIFGDGEQTRDFIYVKDIVAANVFFALESPATGVFNIAYGGKITINDLARRIIELTGSRSQIVYLPERAGDVKHSSAAIDKLSAAGFRPGADFDRGLAETIAYFAAQEKGA